MIPKTHRFHGQGSLNFVYRKGKSVRGELMGLRYVKARQPDYRLAVVVSKKVSKSAVVRNRLRRVIYETVRQYKKQSDRLWPYDLVVNVYDERAVEASPAKLRSEVEYLLQKAGLRQ